MKKIILLFSIILYCLTSKANTFTFNVTPTTVNSGASVTITAVGETQAAHITALNLYSNYGSGGPTGVINTGSLSLYNNGTPTTFQMTFTNPYSNPISISAAFNVTSNDGTYTGIQGLSQNITVNPVPGSQITVNFGFTATNTHAAFSVTVNGSYIGNIGNIAPGASSISGSFPPNSNSTVVFTLINGSMPYQNIASLSGVYSQGPAISGNTITFSNVNLANATTANLNLP